MNKTMNRMMLFLLAAVLVFSVAACGGVQQESGKTEGILDANPNTKEEVQENVVVDDETDDTKLEDEAIGEEEPVSEQVSSGPERIGIYTIDEVSLDTVSLTAMINTAGGLTADAVVDAVILALEDYSLEIYVNGTNLVDGIATVDIQAEDSIMPFGNEGSSVESVILDCISYSLFDNFDEIKAICFTVNGEDYESGHIHLPAGEPYLKRE